MSDRPDEIEEEEEHKKTGRSAYFAGVHAAEEGFSGSYRGVKAAPHGGAASVKDEDTIGSLDCWCGQPLDHDWPGKARGVRHPRKEKAVSTARAATEEQPYLNARDLRVFDQRVIRMLTSLVNDYGVKHRLLDGAHILIYGLDGTSSLKVSASRKAEASMTYIEKFTRTAVTPYLVENQVQALAAQFNDPTKKPRQRKVNTTVKAATVQPEPEVVTPDPEPVIPEATPEGDAPPEGHEQHVDRGGQPMNWWKKIGANEWICKSCGHHVTGTLQGTGSHQRLHTQTPEERSATSALARQHTDNELQGRRARARNAIKFLAEEYDIKLAGPKADNKKVAKLEEQLAKVTAERDDLKARLDLMREAMRA